MAIAEMSGENTLGELVSEFGVHATVIYGWRLELVTCAGALFDMRWIF